MPRQRLRGARAKGKTYERKIQRIIRDWAEGRNAAKLYTNQWLLFSDANGVGYAQPDVFVVLETEILLFEAKLTQTEQAEAQCLALYAPLLERIFARPITCCQVFKNIRYLVPDMIGEVGQLEGKRGYWQWHNPLI